MFAYLVVTCPQVVNESSTGSTTSKRVRLSLTIAVERVDFDSDSCLLRLSGRNSEENPHVKVGCVGVCVSSRSEQIESDFFACRASSPGHSPLPTHTPRDL